MTSGTAAARAELLSYPHLGGDGHDLAGRPLAAIDVETTGFTPGPDRVVEVAVVRIRPDGRVEDRWESLINPQRDVGPTHIHHITDTMAAGAPVFADVAGELLARLDGAVVVAHNARFDSAFIANELTVAGIAVPPLHGACTIQLARWAGLAVPNYKLATCCGALGLSNDAAHTALGDAGVTASLAAHLVSEGLDLRWDDHPAIMPSVSVRSAGHTRSEGFSGN